MTDHTIVAHFQVFNQPSTRAERIMQAMAVAIGGNQIDAARMASRLYRAVEAMRIAEAQEDAKEAKK